MDKSKVIELFQAQIREEIGQLEQAARTAHEEATHPENQAENKYDTRGLEASYLAEAQAKRVQDMRDLLNTLTFTDIQDFDSHSPISSTALVEIAEGTRKSLYLLMPKGGGRKVSYQDRWIQLITPSSPLGRRLLGKCVGDDFELSGPKGERELEILAVW